MITELVTSIPFALWVSVLSLTIAAPWYLRIPVFFGLAHIGSSVLLALSVRFQGKQVGPETLLFGFVPALVALLGFLLTMYFIDSKTWRIYVLAGISWLAQLIVQYVSQRLAGL